MYQYRMYVVFENAWQCDIYVYTSMTTIHSDKTGRAYLTPGSRNK